MPLFALSLLTLVQSATGYLCPAMPEPSPLQSASFVTQQRGSSVSIGAAPSFLRMRFALRVARPAEGGSSILTVVRLKRGWDCNLHKLDGRWTFALDKAETRTFFDQVDAWQKAASREPEITLDGTRIEFRRSDDGRQGRWMSSNGPTMAPLSATALNLLKRHLPASAIPGSDWSWITKDDPR